MAWKKGEYDKEKAAQERKEKVQDAMNTLEKGVLSMNQSEQWLNYLKLQSRFHRYSFSNTMMILMQKPNATYVASYTNWQKLGRTVKKGEHGIMILAPRFYDKQEEDSEGNLVNTRKMYFVTAYVFDASQTEPIPGKEDKLESGKLAKKLTGDDMKHLLDILVNFSENENECSVSFEHVGIGEGAYYPFEHRITIKSTNEVNQQVKTLTHEIGHSMLHKKEDRETLTRADRELEAESVAYIVLHTLGFDTSEYSFGYLAGWASSVGKDFSKEMKKIGDRVQKASKTILDYISKAEGNTEEIDEVA